MNTKHVTEAVNQKTHKNADCGPSLVPPPGVPEWPGSGRSTLSANPVLEPGGRKAEDRAHWGVASRQWDFYPYSLVTTGRVPGTGAKVTVRLQGSRTRAQAEKQLLRALQALAVGQEQGQSEARQLGGQSCLGGQVWLPCGGRAGGPGDSRRAAPGRALGRRRAGGTALTSPGWTPCPPAGRRTGGAGPAGVRSSRRSASCFQGSDRRPGSSRPRPGEKTAAATTPAQSYRRGFSGGRTPRPRPLVSPSTGLSPSGMEPRLAWAPGRQLRALQVS